MSYGYTCLMSVRAIRGATQVEANTAESIYSGVVELLSEILSANGLTPQDVISVLFTSSPDLNAAFPAAGAREVGFASVPLICASADSISHIYLHGAKSLRRDIAQ